MHVVDELKAVHSSLFHSTMKTNREMDVEASSLRRFLQVRKALMKLSVL